MDKIADIHQPLAYSGAKVYRMFLGLGLLSLAIGIGFSIWQPGNFDAYDRVMTIFAFVLGIGMTLYGLHRLLVPGKPLVLLTPQGLRLHIEWVKDIDIPWREVRGVETADITGTFRGRTVFFPGVTVVLVSREFYNRHIHVDSWFLRGPGWDVMFVPKGQLVQVALHHEALPATAEELRAAVEARWRTFGPARPGQTGA